MDIANVISKNLTAWMDDPKSSITLEIAAERSGVGYGTIRRAKNGEGNITTEKLAAIAEAFGKTPAELVTPPAAERTIRPDGNYALPDASPPAIAASPPPTPLPIRSTRQHREDELTALVATLDDFGLVVLIEKAKELAITYPARKGNAQ